MSIIITGGTPLSDAPPVPVLPPFDDPLKFDAHLAALRQYTTWLMDAVINQHPEEGYTIQHAVHEALQLDELKDLLTVVTDKEIKPTRDEYQGKFAQYLFDSKLENSRVTLIDGGSRMIYKRTTTSYTAGDAMSLRSFIIQNPQYVDLLQMRLSKDTVEGFAAANQGLLPPGVSAFTEVKAHLKK